MRVVRGHSSGLHKLLCGLDRSVPDRLAKSKATASTQRYGNGLRRRERLLTCSERGSTHGQTQTTGPT